MENEEKKDEKGCCSSKKCCCCAGKAVAAVLLLLAVGLGGFFIGRHCGMGACPLRSMPAVQTPAK